MRSGVTGDSSRTRSASRVSGSPGKVAITCSPRRTALTVVRVELHSGVWPKSVPSSGPSTCDATSMRAHELYGDRPAVFHIWAGGKTASPSLPHRAAPTGALNSSIGDSTSPPSPKTARSHSRPSANGA